MLADDFQAGLEAVVALAGMAALLLSTWQEIRHRREASSMRLEVERRALERRKRRAAVRDQVFASVVGEVMAAERFVYALSVFQSVPAMRSFIPLEASTPRSLSWQAQQEAFAELDPDPQELIKVRMVFAHIADVEAGLEKLRDAMKDRPLPGGLSAEATTVIAAIQRGLAKAAAVGRAVIRESAPPTWGKYYEKHSPHGSKRPRLRIRRPAARGPAASSPFEPP